MAKQVSKVRLKAILRGWPANPSMKGRDLGEFLASSYQMRLEKEQVSNVRRNSGEER